MYSSLPPSMSINDTIESYCAQLRRRAIEGSLPTCKRTAEIMRLMVTNQKHADASALIDEVRAVGHRLQQAKPSELAIGNIVRRVLHIIREEAQQETAEAAEETSSADAAASARVGLLSMRSFACMSRTPHELDCICFQVW